MLYCDELLVKFVYFWLMYYIVFYNFYEKKFKLKKRLFSLGTNTTLQN